MKKPCVLSVVLCVLAICLSSCLFSGTVKYAQPDPKFEKVENFPEYMGQFIGVWKDTGTSSDTLYNTYEFFDNGTYGNTKYSYGKSQGTVRGRYKVTDSQMVLDYPKMFIRQYLFNDDGTLTFFWNKSNKVESIYEKINDLDALLAQRPAIDKLFTFEIPASHAFANDPELMKKIAGVWKDTTRTGQTSHWNQVFCFNGDGTGFSIDYTSYRYGNRYRIEPLFKYRVSGNQIMLYYKSGRDNYEGADGREVFYKIEFNGSSTLLFLDSNGTRYNFKKIDDDASVHPFDDMGKFYDL